jgi:transposase
MSHVHAWLTFHGRLLLVRRVRLDGWPVAYAAKAMGISRQCAHRWVAGYDTLGEVGQQDRFRRPRISPTRTAAEIEQAVRTRRPPTHRRGPAWIPTDVGVPAWTVSRILRRHNVSHLRDIDMITGEVIRVTAVMSIATSATSTSTDSCPTTAGPTALPCRHRRARRPRHQTPIHQAIPPVAERQGRTLQPHPAK